MSKDELAHAYKNGRIGRRTFVKGMMAAGVGAGAAVAYAQLLEPKAHGFKFRFSGSSGSGTSGGAGGFVAYSQGSGGGGSGTTGGTGANSSSGKSGGAAGS